MVQDLGRRGREVAGNQDLVDDEHLPAGEGGLHVVGGAPPLTSPQGTNAPTTAPNTILVRQALPAG